MRRTTACLLPALAATLTLAACGSSSYSAGSSSKSSTAATAASQASNAASSSGAVVQTAANPTLGGSVLTDAHGITLYRLSGEQAGKFICTSAACLQVWHPLAVPGTGAPRGAVGSLGTVTRPDGSEQVTYKGMPLYTFAEDRQPGDAKGQGLKDVGTWNAVTVVTTTKPAAPASQSPETTSNGGYHY